MKGKTLGFIGGGRVTRIIIGGFARAGILPRKVFVSDTDEETLTRLKKLYPRIEVSEGENRKAALGDIVFLALHPPALKKVLPEIKNHLKTGTILLSLAPKVTMKTLTEKTGGFARIIRSIPNAPSIINCGYNPVAISSELPDREREEFLSFYRALGECPVVPEDSLEIYAILTGMGPTYFWFQIDELVKLCEEFGLAEEKARRALSSMVKGAVKTMFDSELTSGDVMDLVPVKPLGDKEELIRSFYRSRLYNLFRKLRE